MNLKELYESFSSDPQCKELLLQSHWFASFADFDPKTGETLSMPLSRVLERISSRKPSPIVKDRLWLLMDHSYESAIRLMKALSEEPRREPAYLPIREVRELDTASFIALSRRPGRNIREKLADKPYMQAVRHFQSIDVPENRLLKAYLMQLADALELRKKYLRDKTVDDFLQRIYRWLNEDEIRGISRWESLAPNNALLSHRDYRRIWNSWRWLQSIDDAIEYDMHHFAARKELRSKWNQLGKQYTDGIVFADMPVDVNFGDFSLKPWDPAMPTGKAKTRSRETEFFETREPACLDLTQLKPVFATPTTSGSLDESFFWQRWHGEEESTDIELFDSDGVYLHPDATTITCADMFFCKDAVPEALNQASRAFTVRLREHFRNGRLIWLTPDGLSDFELELVRRSINASFPRAEPLPCSVAAVFKHIDYSMIAKDGYKVAVVENINGKSILTEMVSRYDKELHEALPETRGFIWEKGASEQISNNVECEDVKSPVPMLSKEGNWFTVCNPYGVAHKYTEDILMDQPGYDKTIWLNSRPVEGGIKLYQYQTQVRGIPLWRYRIPELMTKVMVNGYYQPFFFVGKNVTVQPARGRAVRIDVPHEFTLPAKKKAYRLPLLQGANEDALEYEAKLVSKDLPYSEDVPCRLEMTYTYGADDPYHLVFRPLDKKYRPINVIWQHKEDVEIDDAPGPAYPQPLSWAELQQHYNPKKKECSDLVDWALDSSKKLDEILASYCSVPKSGRVAMDWRTDRNGKRFTFVHNPHGDDYFIHENALANGVKADFVSEDSILYFFIETYQGKTRATHVAPKQEWSINSNALNVSKRASKYVHSAMYVPFIRIWSDGKSCSDRSCPAAFRNNIFDRMNKIFSYVNVDGVASFVKNDIVFLMCCMGKDMPSAANAYIMNLVAEKKVSDRSLGFALGDVSADWQKRILRQVIEQNNGFSMRVLAHAIWRHERFIDALSLDDIHIVLGRLNDMIQKNSKKLGEGFDSDKRKGDVNHTTRYLELLLGLLRLRDSTDPERSILLQPSQDLAKEFAGYVDLLVQESSKHHDCYYSRVQLDMANKPSEDKTPDLLYALRMYLTGDDSANAIRITGIVEDDG